MTVGSRTIALIGILTVPALADAQRVVVDDSLSPKDFYGVELSWEQPAIRQALASLLTDAASVDVPMIGRIPDVEVRLDTREFEGAMARIFLSLPPSITGLESPDDLELRWEAERPFLDGSVRPGLSELVFEGIIEQPMTTMRMNFVLLLYGAPDTETFDVEPHYEIEIMP